MSLSDRNFYNLVEKTLKISLVILIIASLLLFIDPANPVVLGFVAGLGISIVNTFFLALRVDRVMVVISMDHRKAGLFMNLGHAARWTMIVGAAYLMVTSGWFNLIGAAAGFYLPLVLSLGGIMRSWIYQGANNGAKI